MKPLLLLAALLHTAASAETIAITGATVAIGDGSQPAPGTVVIRDGRIAGAGASVAVPAGARIIDGTGKWVSPGIVAGFTRLGIVGVDGVDETDDADARGTPFNAALDVAPAVNPRVPAIAINRAGGVTRAIVAPSTANSLFAGQGAIIDTANKSDIVDRPRAFQFVEFGEPGATRAGGSRVAAHAYFRNALLEARRYARSPASFDGNGKDAILTRADAAALVPVVEGRQPLFVHVESGGDILQMLRLKAEFPALRLVIVGASEGWTVARELAAARVPVIASALNDLPASFEATAATQSNVGRMKAAGVEVAIGTIDDDEARMAFRSTQYAGNLVALGRVPGASGMSWGEAFAAITSIPARLAGLTDAGSLRAGAGDVVLWSGDPLELSTAVERVWIGGVEQPLTTRQSRLRERYRTPGEGQLPKAYDR